MSGYMLDSNVLIDLAREPDGQVALGFDKAGGDIAISVFVAGEIHHGILKNPSARSNERMKYLLDSLRIDPMDHPIERIYGAVRIDLERKRAAISPNDYWIVAHAIARDAVLVTSDRAIHSAGVANLKLEDWRVKPAGTGQD